MTTNRVARNLLLMSHIIELWCELVIGQLAEHANDFSLIGIVGYIEWRLISCFSVLFKLYALSFARR